MASDTPKKSEAEDRIYSAFPGDLPVDKDNLWVGDCANRKVFAEQFIKIIGGIGVANSKVFLLDGEWGSGKTYFLKNLRYELDGGYKAIYFDAFAEDFSSDPLLAICGQLWKELNANTLGVKIKNEFGAVLKDIMAIGAKAVINVDVKEEGKNVKTKGFGLLVEYAETRKKLENLKERLSDVVKKCQGAEKGEEKPLVFIIDELDRCRPTFALELLERVKHLFEAPGIIFIFGARKEAFKQSVRSQYGHQDDTYLEKFFDFDLKLPNAPAHILAREYIENINYKALTKEWGGEYLEIKNYTGITEGLYYPLIDIMELTPRDVKRSLQMLQLCLLILGEGRYGCEIEAVMCLILLKIKFPALYAGIAYKGVECREIVKNKDVKDMFDKWYAENSNQRLTYSRFLMNTSDSGLYKYCREHFYEFICFFAEEEEKKLLMKPYNEGLANLFGIASERRWLYVQESILPFQASRAAMVRALENLDCVAR